MTKFKSLTLLTIFFAILLLTSGCSNIFQSKPKLTPDQVLANSLIPSQSYVTTLGYQPMPQNYPPGLPPGNEQTTFACLGVPTSIKTADAGMTFFFKAFNGLDFLRNGVPLKMNAFLVQSMVFKSPSGASEMYNAVNTAKGATCVIKALINYLFIYVNVSYQITSDELTTFKYNGGTGLLILTSGDKLHTSAPESIELNIYAAQLGKTVTFLWSAATAAEDLINNVQIMNAIYTKYQHNK